MATSRSQAMLNNARTRRLNADKIEDLQDADQKHIDKKSKNSGWGRFLGAVAFGTVTVLTGGTNLAIAGAAGLGSYLGSKTGEYHADEGIWGEGYDPDRPDEKEVNYYKDELKVVNRDKKEFEKEFDTQQIVNAAKDGYTAYNVASVASNYGKEVVVDEAGKKVVQEQTAKEGLKKMGSDWKNAAKTFFKKDSLDDVTNPTMLKGKLTYEQAEALYNAKKAYTGTKDIADASKTLTDNGFKDMIKKKAANETIEALSKLSNKTPSSSDQKFMSSKMNNKNWLNEYQ